jgi:hypothetical protein
MLLVRLRGPRSLDPFWMALKVYPFWRDKSSGARKGFVGSGRIAPPGKLCQV